MSNSSLDIVYWNPEEPGACVDADGRPVALVPRSCGRCITEVHGNGRRVAALIHDEALEHSRVLTEVARAFARMALENQRLETQLRASLSELRASRLRILSAADRERRRIERDLHDGAQQRLVALGIQLELAADLIEADPSRAAGRLRELARDVDDAVDEVRTLARGLVPPMLVERGLADALREIAVSSPLRTTVQATGIGRYEQEIESAVYFCCLEALQNAAKHAAGARSVTVKLWEDRNLHFEVRDDGAGLPGRPNQHGAGLTNMRDRIGAVGGRLMVESAPGEGTCVAGAAPLAVVVPRQTEVPPRRATHALEDCFAIHRGVRSEPGVELGLDREELVGRNLRVLHPASRGVRRTTS